MDGMRISQLADRSGVPVSTLRYYETEGLLPTRRADNGYRVYDEAAVDRLAFIDQAKSLSLPLAEIRELVLARDSESCRAVQLRYRPMLDERAAQVQTRIEQLRALQSSITEARRHLDEFPDRETSCDAACVVPRHSLPSTTTVRSETLMITIDTPEVIACSLQRDEQAERATAWRALVADMPCERVEHGLRFQLPVGRLETATELAVAEQRCCSFYRIAFDLHGPLFDLTVIAPPQAAGMLAELFDLDASW